MDKGTSGIPDMTKVKEAASSLVENMRRVFVGREETVEMLLVALLCEGHVLIEDVPGTGKTVLAKAAAKSLGLHFQRVQCTPDLLPSDVTGIHYFNQRTQEFELRPGPIVTNVLLADEINRATPRTQSCLLESMQEQQVTVDLETVPLPRPFLIIATQNPVELEGTFPLPEAQLDRFMLKIRLGYPAEKDEEAILTRFQQENPLDGLTGVVKADDLLDMQKLCRQVFISEAVRSYVVAICRSSRTHKNVELGASPRASLALYQASQALAAMRGRNYAIPDDVKLLAGPVLAHRLITRTEARLKDQSVEKIIESIVSSVTVPVEK